jgi:hypothetical protein
MTEFNAANFVMSMALGKAFEAGRMRGRDEVTKDFAPDTWIMTEPDWETWYRKEMKLDEKKVETKET